MNRIIFLLLFIVLCNHGAIRGQATCQWGKGIKARYSGEFGVLTADKAGNVFVGVPATTATLGTITAPFPYVAKLGTSGNFEWVINTNSSSTVPCSMVTDIAGNLYVLGAYGGSTIIGGITLTDTHFSFGNSVFFLTKISPSGTVIWAKNVSSGIFFRPDLAALGYNYLTISDSGNLYIAGDLRAPSTSIGAYSVNNYDASGTTLDIIVARYDTAGNCIWAKNIGGKSDDAVHAISATKNGDFYIAGNFASDTFRIGSSYLVGHRGTTLHFDFLVANVKGCYLAKFDKNGALIWLDSISRHEDIVSLATDVNENAYVSGAIDSVLVIGANMFRSGSRSQTTFFGRYNSNGNFNWGVCSPDSVADAVSIGYGVATDRCGNLWVCGSTAWSNMYFSGHLVSNTMSTNWYDDATYLTEYDTSGNYKTAFIVNGGADDAMGLAVNGNGDLFVSGDYWHDTLIFNGDTLLPDSVREPFFVAKYTYPVCAPDSVFANTDTTLCLGADSFSLSLSAPPGYTSWSWDDGADSSVRNVTAPGRYYVYCITGGTVLIDTFNVFNTPRDTLYRNVDTGICLSVNSFSLSGPPGYASYLWSNGGTTRSIDGLTLGTYIVSAQSSCGMAVDTFKVTSFPTPVITLGNDTIFCSCHSVTLFSPQPAGSEYLWSTGSTQTSIVVTAAGTWWLRVTSARGCVATDTVHVVAGAGSYGHLTDVTQNITIDYGKSIQLNAASEIIYMWKPDDGSLSNPNINNPVATPVRTTEYTVYGYDVHSCLDSTSFTITVDSTMNECLPTAFTPNGDGLNDVFGPACIKFQDMVEFRIYNRWGQQVFFSDNYGNRWDGSFNGVPQDMGTYYYAIVVARPGGNVYYKGDVTLIR